MGDRGAGASARRRGSSWRPRAPSGSRPAPPWPCRSRGRPVASSPTTTSAVNEKRRPPLTTLATRLIFDDALVQLEPVRIDLRAVGDLSHVRAPSIELQSALAGAVGERLDAPVVEVAAAVEHDLADAGGLGPLGDQLADLAAASRPCARLAQRRPRARRRPPACGRVVVDDLRVDVLVRAEHGQARPLGACRATFPRTRRWRRRASRCSRVVSALLMPRLPALRRTCSPA